MWDPVVLQAEGELRTWQLQLQRRTLSGASTVCRRPLQEAVPQYDCRPETLRRLSDTHLPGLRSPLHREGYQRQTVGTGVSPLPELLPLVRQY